MSASQKHISAELRRLADALDAGSTSGAKPVRRAGAATEGRSANLDRVSGFAAELADVVAQELGDGIMVAGEDVRLIGLRVAQRVCDEFGGQTIYVPLGLALQITDRDREMHRYYLASGRDAAATASQFGCGMQNVYRRVAMIESADFAARQGALFDGSD